MGAKNKSNRNIFKKQECQDIYNKLCLLFVDKKEAKNIAIKCIKNNQECDFSKYEETIDERIKELKIQDLKLRNYYNIDSKYVYFTELDKIEEILFICNRGSEFDKYKNYELILNGSVDPITINEKYMFSDISKIKEFKLKRKELLSLNWFDFIFKDVKYLNQLPKIDDILVKIEQKAKNILDNDEVFDIFLDIKTNWGNYEISIVNGREIRKVIFKTDKKCFNHLNETSYLYQTSNSTYICATCLEWLIIDPFKLEDTVLFPLNYNKTEILNWLKLNRKELVDKYMENLLISKYLKIRKDDAIDVSDLSPKLKNVKKQEIVSNLLLLGYPNNIATSNAEIYIANNLCPTYEELEILRDIYISSIKKEQEKHEYLAKHKFNYVVSENKIYEIDYVLKYKNIATIKVKEFDECIRESKQAIFEDYETALQYKEELETIKSNKLKRLQEKLEREKIDLENKIEKEKQFVREKYIKKLLTIGYTSLEANDIIETHELKNKKYPPIKDMKTILDEKVALFEEENELKTKYRKKFKYVVTLDGMYKIRYLISMSNNLFTFNVEGRTDALTVGLENIFAHRKSANKHFEYLNSPKYKEDMIEYERIKKLIGEDPFYLKKELEQKYKKEFKYAVTRDEIFTIKTVIFNDNNIITLRVNGSVDEITVHLNQIFEKLKTAKKHFEKFDKIQPNISKEESFYKENLYELEKKLNRKLNYVVFNDEVYTIKYLYSKETNSDNIDMYTFKVLEMNTPVKVTLDLVFNKKRQALKYLLNS